MGRHGLRSGQLKEGHDLPVAKEGGVLEILRVRRYSLGYQTVKMLMDGSEYGSADFEITSAYDLDGRYLGDSAMASMLCVKGISVFRKTHHSHCVCSIGLDEKRGVWYGWSHRAIVGFSPGKGHKVFDPKFRGVDGDETLFVEHGTETIRTLRQARTSAQRFARFVS